MLLSTKGRYALRVMLDLASRSSDEFVKLMDIAKDQNISEKYLESIVSMLVKGNLVTGVRGKGGGYKLVRKPSEYSVQEILELTEGSLSTVACLESEVNGCPRANECITLPVWTELNNLISDYLNSISLADILKGGKKHHGPCGLR